MKCAMVLCAMMAFVACLTTSVSAGQPLGEVPAATLGDMGFGGAEILSDAAGLAVRGKGTYAHVWGSSYANFWDDHGNSHANNNYTVGAEHRFHSSFAEGGSHSFAGLVKEHGRQFYSRMYVSGGSAWGYAR